MSVKTVQQFERERKYKYVDLANSGKMRMYVCIFKLKEFFLVFLKPPSPEFATILFQ
jgi:hypothetical protein